MLRLEYLNTRKTIVLQPWGKAAPVACFWWKVLQEPERAICCRPWRPRRDKGFRAPAAHVVSVPSLLWVWLGLSAPAASVLVGVDDLHKPGRVEHVFALLPEPPLPHTRVALGPLSENTVRELTADLLGAPPSPRSRRSARWPSPSGSPPGCCCRWWRRPPMSGSSPAVGDRQVSPNRCSGRPSWSRCPNRCGRGPAASPYAPASPPAPPRAPWPPNPGRPALADQPGGDRPGDRHPGQRRPHQQPDRTTRINRPPRTVSYHLRKMFGTLSVRSRSELAGTVRPRLREAP